MFVLPRNHSPLTLVVLAVDPPVRKGQTHYSHVLAQFPTDEDVTVSLQLTAEQLAQKNENTVRLAAVFLQLETRGQHEQQTVRAS